MTDKEHLLMADELANLAQNLVVQIFKQMNGMDLSRDEFQKTLEDISSAIMQYKKERGLPFKDESGNNGTTH